MQSRASMRIAPWEAMDLKTTYMGLTLAHPIVCGASPLTADLEMVERLVDAGAAAIVMHSLFEEQIVERHHAHPIAPYGLPPGEYLRYLLRLKSQVRIPIVASLNGTTPEGWLKYARALERAGADALELNYYHVPLSAFETAQTIEERLIDVVAVVKESVSIPVAVKLSPFYTSIPNIAARLDHIGADGLVLFNRFYQADVDPDTRGTTAVVQLSDSSDLLLRLHAIALLSGRVRLSLAITGGVNEPTDVVKALMAGADAVQVVSTVLRHGPSRLTYLHTQLEKWCGAHHYDSLGAFKGSARPALPLNGPTGFGRDAYLSVLGSWTLDDGPRPN
jgi:dihydroorotate dehydrogenase (fumarate)